MLSTEATGLRNLAALWLCLAPFAGLLLIQKCMLKLLFFILTPKAPSMKTRLQNELQNDQTLQYLHDETIKLYLHISWGIDLQIQWIKLISAIKLYK